MSSYITWMWEICMLYGANQMLPKDCPVKSPICTCMRLV